MIRIAVLVLLAANLLYLGWSLGVGKDSEQLTAVTASTPSPAPVPAAALPAGPPPCATLGPFGDALLALQVEETLKAAGWGVMRREATETLREGWWVHVDNTDAIRQVRTVTTLRRAGISDAFAMPDNPQFRVSVGIFSTEERAEDRAAQVQRLQLDAVVTERLRDQKSIWIDVPGVARETLSDGRLATAGISLDKLRVESCPPAAQVAPA